MSTTSNNTVSITLPKSDNSPSDTVFNLYYQNGYPPMSEAMIEKFKRLGGEHEIAQILGYGGTSTITASIPFANYSEVLSYIYKVKKCKANVVKLSGYNRSTVYDFDGNYLCTDVRCSIRGARQGSYNYLVQVEFELSI